MDLCGYSIPWWGVCKKARPCKDHKDRKCWKCSAPATNDCGDMSGSFMCGVPCCDKHPHTQGHR